MVSVIALRNYKRVLFEQVPHWCGMMSRVGRFGKASAAPPVAGDVSAALPKMVRNSPPLGLILRPRAHTTTLLIGRVVHHSKLWRRMSALPPIADILGLQKERDRHNGGSPQSP